MKVKRIIFKKEIKERRKDKDRLYQFEAYSPSFSVYKIHAGFLADNDKDAIKKARKILKSTSYIKDFEVMEIWEVMHKELKGGTKHGKNCC